MGELRVAVWNVENLFEPGLAARGPRTQSELDAKLGVVAQVVGSLFGGHGPDVLGLAEVGSKVVLDRLLHRLGGYWSVAWAGPGAPDQTGLAVIARQRAIANVQELGRWHPDRRGRPRGLLTRCTLAGSGWPILVAMNHWKSRLPGPGDDAPDPATEPPAADPRDRTSMPGDGDRRQTAEWLTEELQARLDGGCAIVMGDFNAEPFEHPCRVGLHAGRFFTSATRARQGLYNPTWRWLREPLYWEQRRAGCQPSEPKRSWISCGVVDQIMVSEGALLGKPLSIREATVRFHCDDLTSQRNRLGELVPRRWSLNESGQHEGVSDHFPLLAEFDIT